MSVKHIKLKRHDITALRAGRKHQMRLLVPDWQLPSKTQDEERFISIAQRHRRYGFGVFGKTEAECMANYNKDYRSCCPYGAPGDLLWVRENFWQAGDWVKAYPEDDEGVWSGSCRVFYSADGNPPNEPNRHYPSGLHNGAYSAAAPDRIWRSRPSVHMLRWASRLTLEITGVRVERLQDISETDAIAEGIEPAGRLLPNHPNTYLTPDGNFAKPTVAFQRLWQCINGPDSWGANPWVWVIEFKAHHCNVDALIKQREAA